jgi:hypothetical protein
MKIICYTSITDEKDFLLEEQVKGYATFVAFMDKPTYSKNWEIRKAYDRFVDPRRNSRIQKILAHQYIDAEYSIYLDGNIIMMTVPELLIGKHLSDCDIAVYKHPGRDCIYEEATVCAMRNLDDPEVIAEQMKTYQDKGYKHHKGLNECGIILRRHTRKVEEFNNAWWSEFSRHSRRDQISFMFAADRVGIPVKSIHDFFIEKSAYAEKQSGDWRIVRHGHMR